ncbi:MAG: YpsA SLOG family protein [Gammaproteobacteria bacterium]
MSVLDKASSYLRDSLHSVNMYIEMIKMPIEKVVSRGQTGVDTAALDVAISLGISHGG